MDGCQECLRESRGDRVMSHDERTCPEASTWHVQSLFKIVSCEVTAAFAFMVTHYAFGGVADLLVLSSSLPSNRCVRAPPALPECFPSSLCSSRCEGVGFAADSPGLVLRQFFPLCFPSSWRSWSHSSLLFVVLTVPSNISGFTGFRGILSFRRFCSFLAVFLASGFTRISECGGHFAQILHAELSSNVLMGQACYFMVSFMGNSTRFHIHAHWEDTDPVGVGILQTYLICMSPLYTWIATVGGSQDLRPILLPHLNS